MKNRIVTMVCLIAVTSLSVSKVHSAEFVTDTGGAAYEDTYSACCISPAVVFAAALLAAIIAVGLHNSGNGHGHAH